MTRLIVIEVVEEPMLVVPDSIHLQHVFTSPTKRILHCRLLRVTRSDIVESVGVGGPRGVPQNEGTAGKCVVFTENGGFARGFGSLRRLQVVGMIDLVKLVGGSTVDQLASAWTYGMFPAASFLPD